MGLSSTTHTEIEGGMGADNASTRGLTQGVIHQQREVNVMVAQSSAEADEHTSTPPDARPTI